MGRTGKVAASVALGGAALAALGAGMAGAQSGARDVVFSTNRTGESDIYTMRSDGSGQTRITRNRVPDLEPEFSPNGRRIVFRRLVKRGAERTGEIYTMRSNGRDLKRLTNDGFADTSPSYSPDGRFIVWRSRRAGNNDLFVMRSNGSAKVPITAGTQNDDDPVWAPDGQRIVFHGFREGAGFGLDAEIFTVRPDGTELQQITSNDVDDVSPSFSPDGRTLAIERNVNGNSDIYVLNADGTGQRRLTSSPAIDRLPAWLNGRDVLFESTRAPKRFGVEIYAVRVSTKKVRRLTRARGDDGNVSALIRR